MQLTPQFVSICVCSWGCLCWTFHTCSLVICSSKSSHLSCTPVVQAISLIYFSRTVSVSCIGIRLWSAIPFHRSGPSPGFLKDLDGMSYLSTFPLLKCVLSALTGVEKPSCSIPPPVEGDRTCYGLSASLVLLRRRKTSRMGLCEESFDCIDLHLAVCCKGWFKENVQHPFFCALRIKVANKF